VSFGTLGDFSIVTAVINFSIYIIVASVVLIKLSTDYSYYNLGDLKYLFTIVCNCNGKTEIGTDPKVSVRWGRDCGKGYDRESIRWVWEGCFLPIGCMVWRRGYPLPRKFSLEIVHFTRFIV